MNISHDPTKWLSDFYNEFPAPGTPKQAFGSAKEGSSQLDADGAQNNATGAIPTHIAGGNKVFDEDWGQVIGSKKARRAAKKNGKQALLTKAEGKSPDDVKANAEGDIEDRVNIEGLQSSIPRAAAERVKTEAQTSIADGAHPNNYAEAQKSICSDERQMPVEVDPLTDGLVNETPDFGKKPPVQAREIARDTSSAVSKNKQVSTGMSIAEAETSEHPVEETEKGASSPAAATKASSEIDASVREKIFDDVLRDTDLLNATNLKLEPKAKNTVLATESSTIQDKSQDSIKLNLIAEIASRVPKTEEKIFLGDNSKRYKRNRQLAITRCLDSISGGTKQPWIAYPGHTKLTTLDIFLTRTQKAGQYTSKLRENADIHDWLNEKHQIVANVDAKPSLKVLFVTVYGGEGVSPTAEQDSKILQTVFERWNFPTAALSVLLRRKTACDQRITIASNAQADSRTKRKTTRVYFVGMKQWSIVWSADPSDKNFCPRAVVMCLDKTWASSVPGVMLQYCKTMWMFLGYQGLLPLLASMASIRYISFALDEDDKEALQREYELRVWLKDGIATEKRDLGYTSAQVSWLSSRVSRQRDRLLIVNRMLGISKENLIMYDKVVSDSKTVDVLRVCIENLADMMEQLRIQAVQLESQADVQLTALFNLINQADSAAAMMIARTSQSIAVDSRRDQKISVDIANSSRLIALNTLRDSASMKAIAGVTMVFLPGTFLASIFAMPFFDLQNSTRFFVSSKIWVYVAVTVPLTIATLAVAWIWYRLSATSQRKRREADAEENQNVPTHLQVNHENWEDDIRALNKLSCHSRDQIPINKFPQPDQQADKYLQADDDLEKIADESDVANDWNPMTREFAPSIFGASSFAFTEGTNAASSSDSDSDKKVRRSSRGKTRRKSPSPIRFKPSSPRTTRPDPQRFSTTDTFISYRATSYHRPRTPTSFNPGYSSPGGPASSPGRSPVPNSGPRHGVYANPRPSSTSYYETEQYPVYRPTRYASPTRPRSGSIGSRGSSGSHRKYGW